MVNPHPLDDSDRSRAIRDAGLLDSAPAAAFDRLTRIAARHLAAPVACINIIDADREFPRSRMAPPGWSLQEPVPLDDSICIHLVLSREPLILENAAASPLAAESRLVRELGVRSYLGVPLLTADGHALGTFYVADFTPRAWVAEEVESLVDLAGAVMSEVGLRREVGARREAEAAREAARAEAVQATRAKSEYMSRVSHELRTPMNAILGFAQLLEMDLVTDNDRESVEQILKAGRHLLQLIDEVLEIAQVESGRLNLNMEPVPVDELFQECVEVSGRAGEGEAADIQIRLPEGPEHFVWADPLRLKQVLLNLLSNAIRYNRPEGKIVLSCEDGDGPRVRLIVRDTGPGIPADRLSRLFIPFDRLGAERLGLAGRGLGLPLSKALVEAMGGAFGVESVVGSGSEFWVELAQVDQGDFADREGFARATAAEQPSPTHTILLIEDNLANARLIGHILARRGGVRLLTAMQGRRGIEIARENRPDLIILDLNLPDVAGDEILLRLRADPSFTSTPVVMISGGADNAQVAALLDAGATAFLKKPFEMKELLELVDTSLEG